MSDHKSPRRILLVDNDPTIVDELRHAIHSHCQQWQVETTRGAMPAIERLRCQRFDAIVSDMKMPAIDGAELLACAGDLQPGIIRIIVTAAPSEASLLRSIGPVHQVLSKSSDARLLVEALERAFRLQETLGSDRLRTLTGKLKRLPSPPDLYEQVKRELASETASANAVGRIVAQDIAMSAKLLQLVNSAFFGSPAAINDPVRAVVVLGVDVVKSLVLLVHVFEQLDHARNAGVPLQRIFDYGLISARAAQIIATEANLPRAEIDRAYIGGLLHDVGLLVLGSAVPNDMRAILAEAHRTDSPLEEVECLKLGASHADVGAYLLGLWGLPTQVVEAVAFHHRPHLIASSEIDSAWATRWGHLVAVNAFRDRVPAFEHDSTTLTDFETALLPEGRFDEWVERVAALGADA